MKKYCLVLFLILFQHTFINAQFTLIDSNFRVNSFKDIKYEPFPFVRNTQNRDAEKAINTYLYEHIYKYVTLPNTLIDTLHLGYTSFSILAKEISYQSEEVISISFFYVSYGGYMMKMEFLGLNFEALTGQPIFIDSIFTKEGIRELNNSLDTFRKGEILRLMKDTVELKINASKNKAVTITNSEVSLCLQDTLKSKHNDFSNFNVSKDTVFVRIFFCRDLADTLLNNGGEFQMPVDISTWKKYLTPYGKRILL